MVRTRETTTERRGKPGKGRRARQRVSLAIPPVLYAACAALADELGESRQSVIRQALREYCERRGVGVGVGP